MKFLSPKPLSKLLLAACLLLTLVWPVSATPAERPAARMDAATMRWLAQADLDDTATFIVTLQEDGTLERLVEAAQLPDKASRREQVHQLLRARAERNDSALRALTGERPKGFTSVTVFTSINGFSITTQRSLIELLAKWSQVATIELEGVVQLEEPLAAEPLAQINAVEWNISRIGADRVQTELGINGSGITVGGLDTGVRATHQALSSNYKCAGGSHTNCWFDAISGQAAPYDDNDHGTHTMGTAVGQGGIGVAPGARWIACKAFGSTGSATQTDILQCFDWFLAPGGSTANAPDVVVNSWGSSSGSSTAYQQAVTSWVNAGIYPEFSNGNSGPSCNTVGAPASYTNAVGTGATDNTDTIASFSSRGPSPFGVTKPDLSAPGVSIRSAGGSTDTEFRSLSGTSMAGPHVGGLVALLLDANPALSIAQLTQNMKSNALPISATGCSSSGVPNNIYGWGRIRAFESVQAALGGGGPTPTPSPTAPVPTPTFTPTPTPTPGGGPITLFSDNFESSLGWMTNPNGTDTATTGQWERGDPAGTTYNGAKQLGNTVSGLNDLVTGRLAGSSPGAYDVDGGATSIRSPSITLSGAASYTLTFSFYFAHANNASSADFFRVRVVNGGTTTTVFEELGAANDDDAVWLTQTVSLNAYAGQTIQLLIEAADAGSPSLIEAAVDDVVVIGQ